MFLNIITPCTRPENLNKIEESINIPRENFRWIIVFDKNEIPDVPIPNIAEVYAHKVSGSVAGSQQRNFGLGLVENGHIYFNDDDTTIHKELWENIHDKTDHDFISFLQALKNNTIRSRGYPTPYAIDTHNFIVSSELRKGIVWENSLICDGVFVKDCYKIAKNPLHIDKVLSIYNSLR